ncbi:multicopper oxidase domain-containing protein [Leucobacter chromiiresistens]
MAWREIPGAIRRRPHRPIPGEEWIAEWEVEQAAATCWYHPHAHGTAEA